MVAFPGLVAVPTFANFRRQMRVYKFDWEVKEDDSLSFSHPWFIRDRPELLPYMYSGHRPSPEDNPRTAEILGEYFMSVV